MSTLSKVPVRLTTAQVRVLGAVIEHRFRTPAFLAEWLEMQERDLMRCLDALTRRNLVTPVEGFPEPLKYVATKRAERTLAAQ